MIKWYDAKDRPAQSSWYVEQKSDLECCTFPDLDYQIGWNTCYIPNVDNEVYFKTHLNTVFLGYRIEEETVQFAIQEQFTFSNTVPFVVMTLEQQYAKALLIDVLRVKHYFDEERKEKTKVWNYWFTLSGIRFLQMKRVVFPLVVDFGENAQSSLEEYERAAFVAAQHGYTIEFPNN